MKKYILFYFFLFQNCLSFKLDLNKYKFKNKLKQIYGKKHNFNKLSYNINDTSKLNSKKYNIIPINGNTINSILFACWLVHESTMLFTYNIQEHMIYETIIHLFTLIWQYVGLFIISHDLHHIKEPTLYQNIIGRLSLLFYGGFLLEDFSKNHMEHHKYPGIVGKDPDFDDSHPVIWYFKFMKRYLNIKQLIILIFFGLGLNYVAEDINNVYLFWAFPSLLASIQLFFYGTYLVHKSDGIIIDSLLPKYFITLTSYNFGNHKQHHDDPQIPWYDL